AFYGCTGLTSVTIPNSVTSIGDYAFYGCTGLTSVTIPNSVTSIGDYAFYGCTGLTSITIPENINSIGVEAFYDCTGVTSLIWNAIDYTDNTKVSVSPFGSIAAQITSLTIGENVTTISGMPFSQMKNFTSLIWNAKNCSYNIYNSHDLHTSQITDLTIGEQASKFPLYLDNLTSVTMPKNKKYIYGSNGAIYFKKDGLIYYVDDGESVGVYSQYQSFENIVIPDSVTAGNTFSVVYISSHDGFGMCATSITIPESISRIGSWAFYGCTSLTSIIIPKSVTYIGEGAFYGCTGLTSITIPESVTSIGDRAFKDCSGLTSVTIANSTVSPNAFENCTKLKELTIGANCNSIGDNAFAGCSRLIDITCYAEDVPLANENAFANYNGYLYVPCEYLRYYKADNIFGQFANIECIQTNETELQKDDVEIVPEISSALFSMPKNESANSYTLAISHNGTTFCTLTFNSQGQLANIDFSTTKSYELKAGISAFQFTVTGLSSATKYGYSFKALSSSKSVLKEYTGSFTTKNADGTGGSSQGGEEVGGGSGEGGQGGETETKFTVTLSPNNNAYGSVMGGGEYAEGATATIAAIPASDYKFVQWNDGNTDNPRTITVTESCIYVATFEKISTAINDVVADFAITISNRQILINGEAPAFVTNISGQKIANKNLKSGVYFVNVEGETVEVVK
ncbi:MAG: leucine-rich repeat domain-containing protein, partial [Bacteroidales bacterium]|nr:leucine-rich repeat domain-containing protein [Bacteroidales bacterium]